MGRPSMAKQRIEEILEAYARCVGRHGLDGATLEMVAEESGFSRGHIRHYLGNRDAMRAALVDWAIGRYNVGAAELLDGTPPGKRATALFHYATGPVMELASDNATIDALMGAAVYDEHLRGQLRGAYSDLERIFRRSLIEDFPGAPPSTYRDAARQLLTISFGHWALVELQFPATGDRGIRALGQLVIDRVRDRAAG